ncbi:peroxisomal membrane protein 11B-like [Mya arenaria]|uniref:peroxisomal membrane protein 11B-like n=1 Tax=Mya arenaria TaxID=6604 RepID=UPI0022E3DD00|nr:peroxisomal membrane protein 11B-like [Mya arenaria]XP_052796596.1 peroxisomal membrane protein 11B-like [Mya arenaria]
MTDLISNIIKFNAQTNGRDKVCRLVQYSCRLAWGRIQDTDKKDLLQTLKTVEGMLSMTRKLLRFGKSLDFIQGALKSIHLKDSVLRLSITLSKINQAFYLLFDHFLWFHNVGAVKLDKQYWSEVSSRFYLATLLLNLVRDVYGIYCVIMEEINSAKERTSSSTYRNGESNHKTVTRRQISALEILRMNIPLMLDTVKNVFDLAIPMSALQMVKLSPQKQGMFGIVSSLIAVVTVWNPNLKVVPS